MANVATLLIIMVNSMMMFYLIFFASLGNGVREGVGTAQIVGYGWLAIASSFALYKCSKGKGAAGVVIAITTLPMGMAVIYVVSMTWAAGQVVLGWIEPTPSEITEVCKSGGPRYLASPSSPVHSIAFDWETSLQRARFSYVNKDPKRFGTFRSLENVEYPTTVHFIERKYSAGLAERSNEHWPYMRKTTNGIWSGVDAFTADALVTYEIEQLSEANARKKFELTEITVTDRRTGQVLASLRYPTDGHNTPLCGETSPGEMNIAEFIFKATGVLAK